MIILLGTRNNMVHSLRNTLFDGNSEFNFRLSPRSSPSDVAGIVNATQKCHSNKLILNLSLYQSLPEINIHCTPTLNSVLPPAVICSDTKHSAIIQTNRTILLTVQEL